MARQTGPERTQDGQRVSAVIGQIHRAADALKEALAGLAEVDDTKVSVDQHDHLIQAARRAGVHAHGLLDHVTGMDIQP